MELGRSALIVANSEYDDSTLRKLRSPAQDAAQLARVLGDPEIGDFDVDLVLNGTAHNIREKVEGFFRERRPSDVLVFYISCHGVTDDDGSLYFAAQDTKTTLLESTGVSSEFLLRQMRRSMSKRIVLILDCCSSGAFAKGSKAAATPSIKGRFAGRGRVVLTASDAMEYSFEGDSVSGEGTPSVFTHAIVEGLETGAADRDRDRLISVDELYSYVYDRVTELNPKMTPGKTIDQGQGDLVIAKSPNTPVEPAELSPTLRAAMSSEDPFARIGAVRGLGELLHSSDPALVLAARQALQRMTDDDSRRVSDAALASLGQGGVRLASPEEKSPTTTDTGPEPVVEPIDSPGRLLQEHRFHMRDVDLEAIVRALEDFYKRQKLETQVVEVSDGILIRAREREGNRKKWMGLSLAMTVMLRQQGTELRVKIGVGKWGDKAVVGVAALAFWPALAVPALGAWNQVKLRSRTLAIIEQAGARRIVDASP
jgi:uncharacterized caspase-like protein